MILAYNHDLKQHSQTLRKKMTEAENHLWKRLRGKQIGGLSRSVRQHRRRPEANPSGRTGPARRPPGRYCPPPG
ncbi:MAG: DUF559 domain-containing protein [Candidatus Firestonebacteria bacterium]|nr:DUF559 domain-containing protein [Candidatus Firestonebacteria bacterium]